MNKLIFAFIFGIFLLGLVSAGESGEMLGTYKQNSCITLPQICASCTYAKISSIVSPNQTLYGVGDTYTKTGTFYNYTFCNTSELGNYKVNGYFDIEGVDQVFSYIFIITTAGNSSGTSNSIFNIGIILAVISVMFLFGYFGMKLLDSSIPHFGYILLGVSAMLSIGILYYGVLLAQELTSSSILGIQGGFYGVIFMVVAIIFVLATIFVLISYIKQFNEKKTMEKHGEGYNTSSKQYDY